MISANNEYMSDVSQALYECNADLNIREQCYAREEQIKKENYYKKVISDLTTENARLKALLAEQTQR